ncbi:hypothetical protein RB195_023566 [Necator americanus]|uniref:Uncharacterized protein n=1 Tax=Necator americanus TaxID=51031 RepID=A0ABR1EJQ3_NECAM
MSTSQPALSSSPDFTTKDMDCSTPSPNFRRDPADVQTSVAATVDTTVFFSDDNPVRLTASMENLSIIPTASQVSSACATTPGEVDVESSCSSGSSPPPTKRVKRTFRSGFATPSGSFSSPPPGPSKPWAAASLSHDDTSWASFSEASLAFGSSSQSFCNEDPSSSKGYSRGRGRGPARRLAQLEQSPVRDEEFIPRPVRIPSETPIGFHHYLKNLHPWAKFVNPRPVRVLRNPRLP